MSNFLLTSGIFAALWYILRLLMEMWGKKLLPGWFTYVGGVIAWMTVVSLAGPVWAIGELFAKMFDRPDMGTGFEVGSLFFLISIVGKVLIDNPEILDYARMQPFLLASLKFEHYTRKRDDIFVELDKHMIRQIHKEQTGTELREEQQKKKFIPHTDPQQALKEIEQLRAKPLRSVHFQDELSRLNKGETVEVVDTFKLNAVKRTSHDFYPNVSEMAIRPAEKLLMLKLTMPEVTPETQFNADRTFRMKQNIYDFLQALNTEQWLAPYSKFFDKIHITCHRTDTDTFGLPIQTPFLSVGIATSELRQREGKFFVATELDKIATVSFLSST